MSYLDPSDIAALRAERHALGNEVQRLRNYRDDLQIVAKFIRHQLKDEAALCIAEAAADLLARMVLEQYAPGDVEVIGEIVNRHYAAGGA